MTGTDVRLAGPGDAPSLLDLQHALDHETRYMLLEPGERVADPAALRERLASEADATDRSFTVVAAHGGDGLLAGYARVSVKSYARARRTGYVVMGVRAAYGRRGIGRAVLDAAVEQALGRNVRRLELTVMAHNHAALNLYLTTGFIVEGLRRSALQIDGRAVDEYYMGLLLLDGRRTGSGEP